MIEFYDYEKLVGHFWQENFFVGLFFTVFIGFLLLLPIYRRYLAIRWKRTFIILLLTLPVAYYAEFNHYATRIKYWEMIDNNPLAFFDRCLTPGLFILCAVPFAYRLIGKWFFEKTTEAERTIGWVGVGAWLCPSNLFCALLIAYSYTASYEFWGWNWNEGLLENPYRYLVTLFCVLLGFLLVYPLVNSIIYLYRQYRNNHQPKEDHTAVQCKILDLLRTGKITPQECVDLLTAVHKPTENKQPSAIPLEPPVSDSDQSSNDQTASNTITNH